MNPKLVLPSFRRKPESSVMHVAEGNAELDAGFRRHDGKWLSLRIAALAFVLLFPFPALAASAAGGEVDPFVYRFAIFVLAIFVGYYVVWSVTPSLHTPLMSVTNAISSVIIVGALLAVAVEAGGAFMESANWTARIFGFLALVMAAVNIFGGFLVTQRMLAMYKKKER